MIQAGVREGGGGRKSDLVAMSSSSPPQPQYSLGKPFIFRYWSGVSAETPPKYWGYGRLRRETSLDSTSLLGGRPPFVHWVVEFLLPVPSHALYLYPNLFMATATCRGPRGSHTYRLWSFSGKRSTSCKNKQSHSSSRRASRTPTFNSFALLNVPFPAWKIMAEDQTRSIGSMEKKHNSEKREIKVGYGTRRMKRKTTSLFFHSTKNFLSISMCLTLTCCYSAFNPDNKPTMWNRWYISYHSLPHFSRLGIDHGWSSAYTPYLKVDSLVQ